LGHGIDAQRKLDMCNNSIQIDLDPAAMEGIWANTSAVT